MRFTTRILFTGANKAMALLGALPSNSDVVLDADELRVRMGPLFRLHAPTASVVAVAREARRPISRGVHGWRGRWLVNGSGRGLVRVELEPVARGFVCGVPVKVRELVVSVEDADGFVAASVPVSA